MCVCVGVCVGGVSVCVCVVWGVCVCVGVWVCVSVWGVCVMGVEEAYHYYTVCY